MSLFAELFLGTGRLNPRLRAALESEGLVLVEEGLPGSVHYRHFKAPGRRHHGKVRAERIGLGISDERFVVYCRSGRTKLVDTAFSDPRLAAVEVSLADGDRVSIRIDFDRAEVPKVSGEITIFATTPNAANVVEQLQARLRR